MALQGHTPVLALVFILQRAGVAAYMHPVGLGTAGCLGCGEARAAFSPAESRGD